MLDYVLGIVIGIICGILFVSIPVQLMTGEGAYTLTQKVVQCEVGLPRGEFCILVAIPK